MKNAFIIALAMFAFTACKNAGTGAAVDSATSPESRTVETVYDIAYIQIDSLVANYDRAIDLGGAFEAKATKIQNDLAARARSLQNDVTTFQDKVNRSLITTRDAQTEQTRLMTREEQLNVDSQNRQAELAEENQVMMNQIFFAIQEYVARFNADYRYKMVLTTSGGTPLLHADPALDITAVVLKGLNEEYAAEKAAAK